MEVPGYPADVSSSGAPRFITSPIAELWLRPVLFIFGLQKESSGQPAMLARLVNYGLGITLFTIGGIAIMRDSNTNFLWSVLAGCTVVVGGILINRGAKNKPLLPSAMYRPLKGSSYGSAKGKGLAVFGLLLFVISGLVPFLGNEEHLGYNQSHGMAVATVTFVISIPAAYLIWRYLRAARKLRENRDLQQSEA